MKLNSIIFLFIFMIIIQGCRTFQIKMNIKISKPMLEMKLIIKLCRSEWKYITILLNFFDKYRYEQRNDTLSIALNDLLDNCINVKFENLKLSRKETIYKFCNSIIYGDSTNHLLNEVNNEKLKKFNYQYRI